VFFHLPRAVAGLRIGGLGTFDFPARYYAYLGSAFGAGGVRKRTDRHLTRRSRQKWNIDWLKPLSTPVAVWWSHDRRKVEFDWADVLAGLPGASFPATGFGAADNERAQAHLVRFDGGRRPAPVSGAGWSAD
jgi:Uri superfamily endonuclease